MSKEINTEEENSETLIRGILEEAQAKAKDIENEADQYAQRMIASAESQAKQILERTLKEAEQHTREIMSSAEAKLAREKIKSILEFESKIIRDITKKALDRFNAIRKTDTYCDILITWTCECIMGIGTDEVILEVGDIEKEIITDSFIKKVKEKISHYLNKVPEIIISSEVLPICGIRGKSPDGHMVFDNTFTARFLRKESAMYEALYKELNVALQKIQDYIST